jgi:hypothetical protein
MTTKNTSGFPLEIGTIYETGAPFKLPLDLTTQTIAILARKGKGKSYLASVIAEELLENGQIPVVIDPTGAWWGLKASADGKSTGFPVVIFGGEHADLPLDEHGGDVIARAIVENRFPAIIDLSLLRKGQANRFLCAFLETLYRLNRLPLHLVCDEADMYAPQRPFGEEMRTLGAMEDIVRRGRLRGIGCTLITQRPQSLNKNVLTQAEMLVALGMSHPKDIGAIKEWVDVHATIEESKALIDSLPALQVGVAWFWAPAWGDILEKVRVRRRRTFNSGETPKPGETPVKPAMLAKIDIEKLGDQLRDVAKSAQNANPEALAKRLGTLEDLNNKQHSDLVILKHENQQLRERLQMSVDVGYMAAIEEKLAAALDSIRKLPRQPMPAEMTQILPVAPAYTETHSAPYRPKEPAYEEPKVGVARNTTLTPVSRKFLTVLAQRKPKVTIRTQLAILAGYSAKSGHVDNTLGALRTRGFVVGNNENLHITADGLKILGSWTPLPRGEALVAYWINHLEKAQAAMLRVLVDAYPKSLTKEEIAERAGYSPQSGHVDNSLGRLRTMELAVGDNRATKASDDLF